MDLYFERHDGEAATVEQFVQCFADASGRDLSQFMLLVFAGRHAGGGGDRQLRRRERRPTGSTSRRPLPPTPGQPVKKPMVIPLALGLVGRDGRDLPLKTKRRRRLERGVVELTTASADDRVFNGVAGSAGAVAQSRLLGADQARRQSVRQPICRHLAAHDCDPFNRWQALQTLATRLLIDNVAALRGGKPPTATTA